MEAHPSFLFKDNDVRMSKYVFPNSLLTTVNILF